MKMISKFVAVALCAAFVVPAFAASTMTTKKPMGKMAAHGKMAGKKVVVKKAAVKKVVAKKTMGKMAPKKAAPKM